MSDHAKYSQYVLLYNSIFFILTNKYVKIIYYSFIFQIRPDWLITAEQKAIAGYLKSV